MDPRLTYTLSDFIASGKSTTITYPNMSFIEVFDNIDYPVYQILDDYLYELKQMALTIKLTDEQYFKYVYKPKILANDLYDNPEMDFIIMALNGICNVKEFTFYTLKLLKKDDMANFISQIYNAEKNSINMYNTSHK